MLIFVFLISLIFAKQNSVIMILCRNSDMEDIKKSLDQFERRFNSKFNYPYVFLNDSPWTEEFKRELNVVTRNNATYGQVESKDWSMPKDIVKEDIMRSWNLMKEKRVPYADSESYHNMCRFFSRTFYKHPLLAQYKYYWRIEPGVSFHCDVENDPFDFMEKEKKVYGFTIMMYEYMESIPTLEKTFNDFLSQNQSLIPKNIAPLSFIYNDKRQFNGCHFWSNFEIASFDFFRSSLYNKYVDFLEEKKGFYTERWGDAPVHTFAVVNFLDKKQIHFFNDIGYTHPPMTHCPSDGKNCDCKPESSFDYAPGSCLPRYMNDIKGMLGPNANQQAYFVNNLHQQANKHV